MADHIPGAGITSLFSERPSGADLKAKSMLGGVSTGMAEALSLIMRFASTAVLARLLVPEHFGLIAMVTAVISIVDRFKDFGLSDATIQRENLTKAQLGTISWIVFALGGVLTVCMVAISPVLAWWYDDQRVTGIVVGYSFTLFLAALTIQHQAILRREMRFTALALIQICATIVGITVGIALALHGYGYWALVWKDLTTGVVMAIGTWIAYPWFPSRPVRGSGVASMLRFGRDVTVFNIVFFVSRSLDQIVLGKFWGAAIAGIYRQAYQLITMLITQIQFPFSHVSVSTLSQLQGNPERYRRCYAKYLSVLLFISMPVAVYFAIFSENIVNILLGAQWIQAGPVVRALAIGAFIHPVAESIGLVLFTLGQTNRYCRWGIMNAIFRVAAIVIGLQWGLLGIAIASAGASYLIAITSLVFSLRGTPISGMSVVKEMYSPMLGSLAMGMILILSARNSEWISSPAGTPISLCLAAVTYCLIWYFFPDGKQRLAEYLSYPYEAVRAFSMSRR